MRHRLQSRTIRRRPRHARIHGLENLLSKDFSGILCRGVMPALPSRDPHYGHRQAYRRAQLQNPQSRRIRFPLGHGSDIENLDARCLFGLLHFGQLVLLRQGLEDHFLNPGAAVEIAVGNAENRQLADRGIQ